MWKERGCAVRYLFQDSEQALVDHIIVNAFPTRASIEHRSGFGVVTSATELSVQSAV